MCELEEKNYYLRKIPTKLIMESAKFYKNYPIFVASSKLAVSSSIRLVSFLSPPNDLHDPYDLQELCVFSNNWKSDQVSYKLTDNPAVREYLA